MNFKPNCLPIYIGSLPHTNPKEACEFILNNIKDIPFWPQLPKLSFNENMYVQYAYNLPRIKIDEQNKKVFIETNKAENIEEFYNDVVEEKIEKFSYDRKHFAGFYSILEMKDKLGNILAIKGQTTGPISLGLQLIDENQRSILYNETFMEMIIENLKMQIRWQEEALRLIAKKTIIFIDEPYLTMFGSAFLNLEREKAISYLKEVQSVIKGINGIHCCGNTDWSLVLETDLDILSFDAYNYGHTLLLFPKELQDFINKGGFIAWGIVPSNDEEIKKVTTKSLIQKFEKILDKLEKKGFDKNEVMSSSFISSSCGVGSLSVEGAEDVIRKTGEVSWILQDRYSIE